MTIGRRWAMMRRRRRVTRWTWILRTRRPSRCSWTRTRRSGAFTSDNIINTLWPNQDDYYYYCQLIVGLFCSITFIFPCFLVLGIVTNHTRFCWLYEHNGQSEAFRWVSTILLFWLIMTRECFHHKQNTVYTLAVKSIWTVKKPLLLTKPALIWSKLQQKQQYWEIFLLFNITYFYLNIFNIFIYSCDFKADFLLSLLQPHDPSEIIAAQ